MELQESIAAENNRRFDGQTVKAVIDTVEEPTAYGRTEFDAPEVDNDVIITLGEHQLTPGDFCMVDILDSTAFELHGRLSG
jgi:ribosomal protein S12 methylthiotransferase